MTASTKGAPARASESEPESGHWSRLWMAAVAFAVLPIVVAVVRSVLDHWVPVGDDAYFVMRARDVWTSHIPLLGTWTSASLSLGRNINNAGPLFFDLLAPPVTVFGGAAGVAIGAGLINVLSVLGIAWCALRRGGPLLATVAMLVTGALTWSMGSLLLFDPWQPHQLLLPFLCFMFVAWSLACGDLPALPWAVGLGSLIVQTHLSYAFLMITLSGWGLVGLGLSVRAQRRAARASDGSDAAVAGVRVRPVVVTSIIVAVVCWVQPIIEQVTRDGNLARLAGSSSGGAGSLLGPGHSVQVMAKVLSIPPFWSRSGFDRAFTPAVGGPHAGPEGVGLTSLPGLGVSLLSLGLLVLVLAAIVAFGLRRRDAAVSRAAITAVVGLGAGLFTAIRIPIDLFGVAAHQFRWLWPLGAFIAFVILAAILRARTEASNRRVIPAIVALTGLGLVVAVANLPTHDAGAGPAGDLYAIPVVRDIDRQLARADLRGPVLVDVRDVSFGDPYSAPVMAQLQRQGVDFVVTDPTELRQLGPGRSAAGAGARTRIFSLTGDRATTYSGPARRIAFHAGLTPSQQAELSGLEDAIAGDARAGRIRLNERGEELVGEGQFPDLATGSGRRDPGPMLGGGALVEAYRADALDLASGVRTRVARYATLRLALDRETVGVFAAPLR